MFSKIILKLVDAAILPSLLVFGVKFASTVLFSLYWRLPLSIGLSGFNFRNFSDFYKVNLFSNIILFLFTFAVLFLVLLRLYLFTQENLNPILGARLANLGLESVTVPLWQGYTHSVVWLTLSFSVTLSLFTQALFDFSPFYLFALSGAFLVLGGFVFLLCFERDVHSSFRKERSVVIIEEEINA
ncbi:MAG: hypothetical protein A2048_10300 [Deltaproteobacteria bacterium GWA2_45_12]|nr:MAG: hypothetical protein A2048_10300 [Deltaproteobacteria bacterium GWA2_45_12]